MDAFSLFATPLYVFELADELAAVNGELAARLAAERAAHPGVRRSNVGGWHSLPDLAQRPDPAYRALFSAVVAHVGEVVARLSAAAGAPPQRWRYGLQGWAMILDQGDYVVLHDHAEAHWSIAYYVDGGDDDDDDGGLAGQLAFVDPRRGGRPLPGVEHTAFAVRPRTGRMVVFPGWLQHYVHPHRGRRPRISISCNVVMEPAR